MQTQSQQPEVTTGWADSNPMKPGDVFTGGGTIDAPEWRGVVPIPFRPLHNQVVIRVLRENDMRGSIAIPESANDNREHSAIGIVIAKGQGHRNKSRLQTTGPNPTRQWLGGYAELPVEPGDYVVLARAAGEAHRFGGQTFLVTPVEHIYAVLEGYEDQRPAATEREFGLEASLDKKWNRPASERPRVGGMHAQ
jgi:co-chaperonin GroES (HSP10)